MEKKVFISKEKKVVKDVSKKLVEGGVLNMFEVYEKLFNLIFMFVGFGKFFKVIFEFMFLLFIMIRWFYLCC